MGRKNLHEAFQQIEAQKRAQREKEEQAEREARLLEKHAQEAEAGSAPPPDTDVTPMGSLPFGERAAAESPEDGRPAGAPEQADRGASSSLGSSPGKRTGGPGKRKGDPRKGAIARAVSKTGPAQKPGGGEELPVSAWLEALRQPVVLALFVFVFALGFFFGRMGPDEVRAQKPGGEVGTNAPSRPPGPGTNAADPEVPVVSNDGAALAAEAERAEDPVLAQLLDPSNRWTIQVISYDNSDYTSLLAGELVTYLRESDFPASPPIGVGDKLTVLVGAAAERSDLEGTLAALKRTPGQGGEAGVFSGAMLREIEDLLGRE